MVCFLLRYLTREFLRVSYILAIILLLSAIGSSLTGTAFFVSSLGERKKGLFQFFLSWIFFSFFGMGDIFLLVLFVAFSSSRVKYQFFYLPFVGLWYHR